jgi:16S rRNA G1207 methylase RsmC
VPHYFEPPTDDAAADTYPLSVSLLGRQVDVLTAPGVFSAHRLDPGTSVLLRVEQRLARQLASQSGQLPPGAAEKQLERAGSMFGDAANLLDLGCGWGPISLALAFMYPKATIWAVDVNPLAVQMTALNATNLGLTGVRSVLPANLPAGITFDLIWSNPPIRIGKEPLHRLLTSYLSRLKTAAWADLVVQKNLGSDSLTHWLTSQAACRVDKLGSAKGYRVLRCWPS